MRKASKSLRLPLLLMMAAVVLGVLISSATGSDSVRRKARYYYMEAVRCQAEGRETEAFEYYKKAFSVDPSYVEAASAFGTQRLMLQSDTFQSHDELMNSLWMMRGFVDSYPADLFESRYYAFVASHLDTLGEAERVYERLDSLIPTETGVLVALADVRMASGDLKGALEALDKYEKAEGMSPQLTMKKIQYLLSVKDTVGAVREATALEASNPRDPSYKIMKGNLFSIVGQNDSALHYYLEAEKTAPDNGPAKLALANWYKENGDSVSYDVKTYEALLSEDFTLEDKNDLLADYLQNLIDGKGDTHRGDYLFSVLSNQYPHEPNLLFLSARYNAAKGDFKNAKEQIGYAIDLAPENNDYWAAMMTFMLGSDDYEGAMSTFDRAVSHVEVTPTLRMYYASAAHLAGKTDTARNQYAILIHEVEPSLPVEDTIRDRQVLNRLDYPQLMTLSVYYTLVGDLFYSTVAKDSTALRKTFTAYDNALLFNPDNPGALNNYAYFLAESNGDLDKAYEMSRKAIALNGSSTNLDTYAWILFRRGEYKEAKDYQAAAIEKAAEEETEGGEGPSAELYSHYGDILFMNGEPDEAVEYWSKALELEPDDKLLEKKVTHRTFFYK